MYKCAFNASNAAAKRNSLAIIFKTRQLDITLDVCEESFSFHLSRIHDGFIKVRLDLSSYEKISRYFNTQNRRIVNIAFNLAKVNETLPVRFSRVIGKVYIFFCSGYIFNHIILLLSTDVLRCSI